MAFFGVFGGSREARARFDVRAEYLCSPALHFSLDGKVALCHDGARTLEELASFASTLFTATASGKRVVLARSTLEGLYRRYGKGLRHHIPCPASFALYNAARGVLLLGGAHGEKCFIEEMDGAILFSSVSSLLRSAIPVDLAILKV